MELADRTVVITGAAGGIGRACARAFAAEGARLVLADRDGDRVQEAANELAALGIRVDIGHEIGVRELIQAAELHFGSIDLFYSNAGIGGPWGGPEVSDTELQRTWDVNVMAHLWAARALLPGMVQRGDGYLVSTASAAGLLTQLSALAYSMTKHSAVALAEWLSITYGDAGVKVSCVCPQGVNTAMLDQARDHGVGSAALLAERVIEPEDVAAAVVTGIRDERFLILPHPEVAQYAAARSAQPERWLAGMRRLLRRARDEHPST